MKNAFVMVGAPGSGKSTAARKLAKEYNAVIVCGDEIRRELYGDAAHQGNWVEFHDRIVEQLEENVGKTVILDGTHFNSSFRVGALLTLKTYGWNDISAYVVNPPLEQCLIQNSLRSRQVPRYVLISMYDKLQKSLDELPHEGFTEIITHIANLNNDTNF
jgi:predicted kinase